MKRKKANHAALIPPFPYVGSKAGAAAKIWEYLGNVDVYLEPFAGSLATLLWRPHTPKIEVINDLDGHVINVWRSIRQRPADVAAQLKRPLSEVDLFALWDRLNKAKILEALKADLYHCVPELAALWVAGANLSVGRPWCTPKQAPRLNLGRKDWFFQGRSDAEIEEYLEKLSNRLRHVIMYCGSWERALSPTGLYTTARGPIGVFLDPPYLPTRTKRLYAKDSHTVAHDVSAWCRENQSKYRIVLAGYEGHYKLPGWRVISWKRFDGFSAYSVKTINTTKHLEALYVSPLCEGTQNKWVL